MMRGRPTSCRQPLKIELVSSVGIARCLLHDDVQLGFLLNFASYDVWTPDQEHENVQQDYETLFGRFLEHDPLNP